MPSVPSAVVGDERARGDDGGDLRVESKPPDRPYVRPRRDPGFGPGDQGGEDAAPEARVPRPGQVAELGDPHRGPGVPGQRPSRPRSRVGPIEVDSVEDAVVARQEDARGAVGEPAGHPPAGEIGGGQAVEDGAVGLGEAEQGGVAEGRILPEADELGPAAFVGPGGPGGVPDVPPAGTDGMTGRPVSGSRKRSGLREVPSKCRPTLMGRSSRSIKSGGSGHPARPRTRARGIRSSAMQSRSRAALVMAHRTIPPRPQFSHRVAIVIAPRPDHLQSGSRWTGFTNVAIRTHAVNDTCR